MCATVCPSQALFFGTREEIERLRPRSTAVNTFQFGNQTITTGVHVMVPRDAAGRAPHVDVAAAMDERPRSRSITLHVRPAPADSEPDTAEADPYAEVELRP